MRGERAPANPGGEGATTLEWTQTSPPPFHTFNELHMLGKQIVATGDELVPTLAIFCGQNLRYDPGPIGESIDWTGQTATFTFDFGAAAT